MTFSTYFSEQARNPTGLFGRLVMSFVFDKGNAHLNGLVNELMSIKADDHVLEIGFGTGQLIYKMAKQISEGHILGIDISSSMVSIAERKNRKSIEAGIVKLIEGNFEEISYSNSSFTKVCSVNTIYFWPKPEIIAAKIANLLKPQGKLFIAFEDINQLKHKNLDDNIFKFYSTEDVKSLLLNAGFSRDVNIETRVRKKSIYHCVVGNK